MQTFVGGRRPAAGLLPPAEHRPQHRAGEPDERRGGGRPPDLLVQARRGQGAVAADREVPPGHRPVRHGRRRRGAFGLCHHGHRSISAKRVRKSGTREPPFPEGGSHPRTDPRTWLLPRQILKVVIRIAPAGGFMDLGHRKAGAPVGDPRTPLPRGGGPPIESLIVILGPSGVGLHSSKSAPLPRPGTGPVITMLEGPCRRSAVPL